MDTLLSAWQKANDELIRLFAQRKIIMAHSTRLQVQQIMHDLALTAFRVGHAAGSDLRAQQIADICGAAVRESLPSPTGTEDFKKEEE